jgi:hypothetical protein
VEKKWLKEQYSDLSKPIYKIAEELNITTNTLNKWAKKYGIERKDKYHIRPENKKFMHEEWLYTKY